MPKYYTICSEPGLNYEGKVFTTMAQLEAYKKGKKRPRGKLPWYTCFTNRAEAESFAGIKDSGEENNPIVVSDDEYADMIDDTQSDAITLPDMPPIRKINSLNPCTTTSTSAGSSSENAIFQCPMCSGKPSFCSVSFSQFFSFN